jgi:hypothetical protein
MMSLVWQRNRNRRKVGRAEHGRYMAFGKGGDKFAAPCDAVRGNDQHMNIVDRHATDFGTVALDDEEPAIKADVVVVVRNIDDAVNHRNPAMR